MLLISQRSDDGAYEPAAVYVDGQFRGGGYATTLESMAGAPEDAVAESLADGYTKVVSHPDDEPLPRAWKGVVTDA